MEGLLGTAFGTEILITIWNDCCVSALLARAQKLESPCSEFPVLTFSFHQVCSPRWGVYLMWCWIWVWWNTSGAPLEPPVCRGLLFQLTFEKFSLWLLWIAKILKTVSGCDQRLTFGLPAAHVASGNETLCRSDLTFVGPVRSNRRFLETDHHVTFMSWAPRVGCLAFVAHFFICIKCEAETTNEKSTEFKFLL